MFRVSVIIPVYNAEKFIEQAVQSALVLEETGEVILVEDASPDGALAICIRLEKEHDKVKLYRHPNGENRGAGPSRNLGIEKATCEYISFLDADDYYLPNRFSIAKKVFAENADADFTYGASQMEDDYADGNNKMCTLAGGYKKRAVFYQLLEGRNGDFDTNTITIKKSSLLKVKLFKSELRLHQDTELWFRMAYHLNGYPGCIESPTAIVRRHDQSRITGRTYKTRFLMWEEIKREFDPLPLKSKERLLLNLHYNYYRKAINGGRLNNKLRRFKMIVVTKLFHEYHHLLRPGN